MQVLKFPNQHHTPEYRVHPVTMSDRLRDLTIVHNLPEGEDFQNFVQTFHTTLGPDNALVPLLDLSFRDYLKDEHFEHKEALKYRLGVVVARIVVNTQLVDTYHKSIDDPALTTAAHTTDFLQESAFSRFALRSFYESDEHPEEIKHQIRQEVGHIISPEPETRNDWFAIGMGDGHAVLSRALGEKIPIQTDALDVRDITQYWA